MKVKAVKEQEKENTRYNFLCFSIFPLRICLLGWVAGLLSSQLLVLSSLYTVRLPLTTHDLRLTTH